MKVEPHFSSKLLERLYFAIVVVTLLVLIPRHLNAGQIRRLELTQDHPGIVHLAFGRSTAISFNVRPEKVVPGSPASLQINFLARDLTVTPVARNVGNLLVYTKNGRYVILFQLGSESQYDDVVQVSQGSGKSPLRVLEDSFKPISIELKFDPDPSSKKLRSPALQKSSQILTVGLSSNERKISGDELVQPLMSFRPLHCDHCMVRREDNEFADITCSIPISEIHCLVTGGQLTIRRRDP